MSKLQVRIALVAVLLIGAAALSASVLYPQKMERGNLQAEALPMMLGGWVGQKVAVEEYVKQILETDDVIQRNYTNPLYRGVPVQMAVVYSPDNRRVAHPPEICYKGGGYEINEKREVRIDGLPPMIRLQVASSRQQRDLVLYCFKTGELLTADYLQQQLNIVKNLFTGGANSSGLLRFSTRIQADETDAQAETRAAAFIREMMPEIRKTLR